MYATGRVATYEPGPGSPGGTGGFPGPGYRRSVRQDLVHRFHKGFPFDGLRKVGLWSRDQLAIADEILENQIAQVPSVMLRR